MAKKPTIRPVAPPARVLPREVDMSVLTPERIAEITAKAEAKHKARQLLDAEEAFLEKELARLEKIAHPETQHEMIDVRIDLALYADKIMLDGKQYFHGELYTVPRPVYEVIMEVQQATRRHDAEIHGDTGADYYRKTRAMSVNMTTGQASASGAPIRF